MYLDLGKFKKTLELVEINRDRKRCILIKPRVKPEINHSGSKGADPFPPIIYAKEGRQNSFEPKKLPPFLPTGIGERYSQTILNLGHAALLRRSKIPLYAKMLN
jgi:hypothetical protein